MRGVVLAGGNGTRLDPLTRVLNKHLLPVYDKPMIYYPIETLKQMGCDEIVLVSGGGHIGGFAELLKDGKELGVNIIYRVQERAGGIAEALLCAEGLVQGVFPVILGDNYFKRPLVMQESPCIFINKVPDPERFGVYCDRKIIEKPAEPKSNYAVVGLYIYGEEVFEYIKTLKPSSRGELEITDVNNWYLDQGAEIIVYKEKWRDMGTVNTLREVSNEQG